MYLTPANKVRLASQTTVIMYRINHCSVTMHEIATQHHACLCVTNINVAGRASLPVPFLCVIIATSNLHLADLLI